MAEMEYRVLRTEKRSSGTGRRIIVGFLAAILCMGWICGCTTAFTEEKLRETIEKYNAYVAAQKDDDFGKEVLAGAIDIEAIDANPEVGYCISPRKASLHHTMGGVCIDTETRVLRADGTPIEGLWAAGEVTGGIHAGNRLGGNAIADIFTFGRIAGEQAAK